MKKKKCSISHPIYVRSFFKANFKIICWQWILILIEYKRLDWVVALFVKKQGVIWKKPTLATYVGTMHTPK